MWLKFFQLLAVPFLKMRPPRPSVYCSLSFSSAFSFSLRDALLLPPRFWRHTRLLCLLPLRPPLLPFRALPMSSSRMSHSFMKFVCVWCGRASKRCWSLHHRSTVIKKAKPTLQKVKVRLMGISQKKVIDEFLHSSFYESFVIMPCDCHTE